MSVMSQNAAPKSFTSESRIVSPAPTETGGDSRARRKSIQPRTLAQMKDRTQEDPAGSDSIKFNGKKCTDHQDEAKVGVASVVLVHPVVKRTKNVEVYSGADPSETELQSEDHVQLLTLEPGDCVGVLRHRQRLPSDSENEFLSFIL